MKKTIYVYLDVINGSYKVSDWDYWTTPEECQTGLYIGEYSTKQLVSVQEIEFPGWFNPTSLKIDALEHTIQKELAACHVKVENLKTQIQELKCLGHEPVELGNYKPQPSQVDDDTPF